MAIIDVNFAGVLAVASSIEQTLADAEPDFVRLKNRITDIDTVWTSQKGDSFKKDLENLYESIDSFAKKNAEFVTFLQDAVEAYKQDAQELADAINSISLSGGN